MLLSDLLRCSGLASNARSVMPAADVRAIRYDSRAVRPGDLFVAIRGSVTDGHRHIQSAVEAGAVGVIVEEMAYCPNDVPCVSVASTRAALADLAAALHGFPAAAMHVTGITGTDGKTTSVFLLNHLLEALGTTTGLLSTVAFKIGKHWEDNMQRQSTLEAPDVQSALAAMLQAGVTDAIIEATSHGLALERVRNCFFDDAIITNITSEHLEFHGTRERYVAAKRLLLEAIAANADSSCRRFAAINVDDEGSAGLIAASPVDVVTFGMSEMAEVRATNIVQTASGATFTMSASGRSTTANTTLPGLFNVLNCLGVCALLYGRGQELDAVAPYLQSFGGVPGRMRRVDLGQPFLVVVDYAHTAASLENVLLTLRPLSQHRLIAMFGSAGERDREKRPVMGAVAARLADYSVFTDEDPRWEESLTILAEIAEGARSAGGVEGRSFQIVPNRAAAIGHAIAVAQAGDVVLLAGKGHEQSMIVGGTALPWDEESEARAALRLQGFGA